MKNGSIISFWHKIFNRDAANRATSVAIFCFEILQNTDWVECVFTFARYHAGSKGPRLVAYSAFISSCLIPDNFSFGSVAPHHTYALLENLVFDHWFLEVIVEHRKNLSLKILTKFHSGAEFLFFCLVLKILRTTRSPDLGPASVDDNQFFMCFRKLVHSKYSIRWVADHQSQRLSVPRVCTVSRSQSWSNIVPAVWAG